MVSTILVAAVIWLVEKRAHRFTDKAFELKEADRKEWTIMLAKSLLALWDFGI